MDSGISVRAGNKMIIFVPAGTISPCPTLAPRCVIRWVSGGGFTVAEESEKNIRFDDNNWKVRLTGATADVAILAECIQYNCEGRCLLSGVLEVVEISPRTT